MLTECSQREIRECGVIEVLASHGQCLGSHGPTGTVPLTGSPLTKKKAAPSRRQSH
jgi:hypothetical protein